MEATMYSIGTTYFQLGELAYRVSYSPSSVYKDIRILNAKETQDEFGETYWDVVIEHNAEIPPLKSLYFVKSERDHGFEYWEEYGLSEQQFFADAWVWHSAWNRFVAFEELRDELRHPSLMLSYLYKGPLASAKPVEMLVHHPTEALKESIGKKNSDPSKIIDGDWLLASRLFTLNASERLSAVLNLANHCEYISAWMHGPLRPVIFSKKMIQVNKRIALLCRQDGISLVEKESEADLPSW